MDGRTDSTSTYSSNSTSSSKITMGRVKTSEEKKTGQASSTSNLQQTLAKLPKENTTSLRTATVTFIPALDFLESYLVDLASVATNSPQMNTDNLYSQLCRYVPINDIQCNLSIHIDTRKTLFHSVIKPFFNHDYQKKDNQGMTQLDWYIIFNPKDAYDFIKGKIVNAQYSMIETRHIERLIIYIQKTYTPRQTYCDKLYQEIVKPYCEQRHHCSYTQTTSLQANANTGNISYSNQFYNTVHHNVSPQLYLALYCEQPIEEIQLLCQKQQEENNLVASHLAKILEATNGKVALSLSLYSPAHYTRALMIAMQCDNAELALAYAKLLSPLADVNQQHALYEAMKNDHLEAADILVEAYVNNQHSSITNPINNGIKISNPFSNEEKNPIEIKTILHLAIEKNLIALLNKLLTIPSVQEQVFKDRVLMFSCFQYAIVTQKFAATFLIPYAKTEHFIDLLSAVYFYNHSNKDDNIKAYTTICHFIKEHAEYILQQAATLYNQSETENRTLLVRALFCIFLAKIQVHPFPASFNNVRLINQKEVSATMHNVFKLACDYEKIEDSFSGSNICVHPIFKKDKPYTSEQAQKNLCEIAVILEKENLGVFPFTSLTSIFAEKPTGITLEQDLLDDFNKYAKIIQESKHHKQIPTSLAQVGSWKKEDLERKNTQFNRHNGWL